MSERKEFDELNSKVYGIKREDLLNSPKEASGIARARVGAGMAFRIRPLNISDNVNKAFLGRPGSGKAFCNGPLNIPDNANKAFLGTPGSGKAFRIDQEERCMAEN